jgi:hypothetical protein
VSTTHPATAAAPADPAALAELPQVNAWLRTARGTDDSMRREERINGCARLADAGERLGEPHYYFSISAQALKQQPWRPGTVYLLPAGSFELQPRVRVGDVSVQPAQWASPVPVAPVAKLAVQPEDFPFLDQIRGHDDARVWARAAVDPDGFPWHEEA